jgi:hypothetical protein
MSLKSGVPSETWLVLTAKLPNSDFAGRAWLVLTPKSDGAGEAWSLLLTAKIDGAGGIWSVLTGAKSDGAGRAWFGGAGAPNENEDGVPGMMGRELGDMFGKNVLLAVDQKWRGANRRVETRRCGKERKTRGGL